MSPLVLGDGGWGVGWEGRGVVPLSAAFVDRLM